jgi:hypothetical protein
MIIVRLLSPEPVGWISTTNFTRSREPTSSWNQYHSLTSKKAHDRDVLIGSDLKCSVLRMDGFYGTIPMADAAIATQGPNPKYVVYELPLRWHSKKRGRSNKKAAEI